MLCARLFARGVALLAMSLACPTLPVAQVSQLEAQRFVEGQVQSPILTVEPERLFAQSAFGQRIDREIEAERDVITAENDRIAAELVAEEQSLTEKRDRMAPADFRVLAEAFDRKVQRLRREQDDRARGLSTTLEEARREFLSTAQPVIEAIMRETGAALIVDRRLVFISADVIDITDSAVARINAAIGDGSGTNDGSDGTGGEAQGDVAPNDLAAPDEPATTPGTAPPLAAPVQP